MKSDMWWLRQRTVSALDHALRKALEKDFPIFPKWHWLISKCESSKATKVQMQFPVHVESTDGKTTWGTIGVSDNVITASWEALLIQ